MQGPPNQAIGYWKQYSSDGKEDNVTINSRIDELQLELNSFLSLHELSAAMILPDQVLPSKPWSKDFYKCVEYASNLNKQINIFIVKFMQLKKNLSQEQLINGHTSPQENYQSLSLALRDVKIEPFVRPKFENTAQKKNFPQSPEEEKVSIRANGKSLENNGMSIYSQQFEFEKSMKHDEEVQSKLGKFNKLTTNEQQRNVTFETSKNLTNSDEIESQEIHKLTTQNNRNNVQVFSANESSSKDGVDANDDRSQQLMLMEELKKEELTEEELAEQCKKRKNKLTGKKSKKKKQILKRYQMLLQIALDINLSQLQELIDRLDIDEEITLEQIEKKIKKSQEKLEKLTIANKQNKAQKLKIKLQYLKQAQQHKLKIDTYTQILDNNPEIMTGGSPFNQPQEQNIISNVGCQQHGPIDKQPIMFQSLESYGIFDVKDLKTISNVYFQSNLQDKVNILNNLHTLCIEHYNQLLQQDNSILALQEYTNLKNEINSLITMDDIQGVNQLLASYYQQGDSRQLCSIKIHSEFKKQQPLLLENPIVLIVLAKELDQIQPPENCKHFHYQLIKNASVCCIDKIFKIFEMIDKNELQYRIEVEQTLQKLSEFKQIASQNQLKIEVKKSFDTLSDNLKSLKLFKLLYLSIFENPNMSKVVEIFNQLVNELQSESLKELITLHKLITKLFPQIELTNFLTIQNLFHNFAPEINKTTILELFKQISSRKVLSYEMKERTNLYIEEIFYENAEFANLLIDYLTSFEQNLWIQEGIKTLKSISEKRNMTLEMIITSISYENKKLQTIADFLSIIVDQDVSQIQEDLCKEFRQHGKIQGDMLQIVLYDMIKKRCSFEKFLTRLSPIYPQDKDMIFTQSTLMVFLLNNSDTYLKTLILMACSSFMPLPLITYKLNKQTNEEEFKEHEVIRDNFQPTIYEEMFYTFEKYKAVLNFKLSTNKNKSPHGCTSMANFVFQKSFEKHSKTTANHGAVDIQFDYNFETPMFIPAADAHGLVDHNILKQLYVLFDIFMIHILKSKDIEEMLSQQIGIIRSKNQNPLIFVIEQDDDIKESKYTIERNKDFIKINMCSFTKLHSQQQNQLQTVILEHYMKAVNEFKDYQNDYSVRIKSLEKFTNFTQSFLKEQSHQFEKLNSQENKLKTQELMSGYNKIKEAHHIIKEFMSEIDKNKDQLHSQKVLTMNYFFKKACQNEKRLMHDRNMTIVLCEEIRQDINNLKKEIKQANPSSMTKQLDNIMDHQNFVGITSVISKFLKSYLSAQLKPLLLKKSKIHSQLQSDNLSSELKDKMMSDMNDLARQIEQKWYSNEFLYREYYIHERVLINDTEKAKHNVGQVAYKNYLSLVNLQLSQGQPFEIIDGNNLQFISDVYQRICKQPNQDDNILVVSVIGPQSSGKSLLLNTLFGAQFPSSAGRCTRGIYGSLIDIKSQNKEFRYSKILLLDSEGIQQSEGRDESFDKRIVFYILCVSHIVFICNKGEMNSPMQELIKIATDAISQLRDSIVKKPQVNIIMNMVPQIDDQALVATIQDLSSAILEMSSKKKNVQQLFTINRENVFMLPNAFSTFGSECMIVNQPAFPFANRVDQLKKKVIDFLINKKLEETSQFSLDTWFKFAAKFWKFTDEFEGITEYNTLEERTQDLLLSSKINNIIATKFQDFEKKKYDIIIQQCSQIIFEEYKGSIQASVNEINYRIEQKLIPYKQQVVAEINKEYQEFCHDKGIHQNLKKKRETQLDKQVTQHICGWKQVVTRLISEFFDEKLRYIGDQCFQKAIQQLIRNKDSKFSDEEANNLFMKEYSNLQKDMNKTLTTREEVFENTFQDVNNMYRGNIKNIGSFEKEIHCLKKYIKKGHQHLQNTLTDCKDFFFYSAKTIRSEPQKIINSIGKQHALLQVKDLFVVGQTQEFYNWKQVVLERFQFEKFQQELQILANELNNNWYKQNTRNDADFEKLKNFVKRVNKEGELFGVELSDELTHDIINIQECYIRQEVDLHNHSQKKEMNESEEYEFIKATLIPKFVSDVKKEIQRWFQYKSFSSQKPSLYVYFNIKNINKKDGSQIVDYFSPHKYTFTFKNNYIINFIQNTEGQQLIKTEERLEVNQQITDKYLVEYLDSLAMPENSTLKKEDNATNTAKEYFYSQINHDKIIKQIQHVVLQSISREFIVFNQEDTVEKVIESLKQSNDITVIQNYCTLDHRVIQQTVSGIEGIISILDEELKPYCFQVSENGIKCLHLLAQTYITSLIIEIKWIADQGPVFTLKKNIEVQRQLFIAKLTSNDSEMDKSQAIKTAECLAKSIHDSLKKDIIDNFQNIIAAEQEFFKMRTIVSDIEDNIINIAEENQLLFEKQQKDEENKVLEEKSIMTPFTFQKSFKPKVIQQKIISKEIIEFYVDPKKYLESKFEDKWNKTTLNKIAQSFEMFKSKRNDALNNISSYFKRLLVLLNEKTINLATDAFIYDGQETVQPLNKQLCQKALTQYLLQLLSGQWSAGTKMEIEKHIIITNPLKIFVCPEDIGFNLQQKYFKIIINDLQGSTISNITNFIKQFISCLNQELNQDKILTNQELIGDLYKSLRQKTLGCDKHCPLCRRQCDQDHQEAVTDRVHACDGGHQLQGFGGARYDNDYAILKGCHENADDDIVFYEGTQMMWSIFKGKIQTQNNWFLDEDENRKGANKIQKEKNVRIWNLIGERVCKLYNEDKVPIKFVVADSNSNIRLKSYNLKKTLYILLLDRSSSMSHLNYNQFTSWENLLSAVSKFLEVLEQNSVHRQNSRVSIITYNQEHQLIYDEEIPSVSLAEGLGKTGGSTDFQNPLQCAKDLMEQKFQKYSHFTVCLMSDGIAYYPNEAIRNIKSSTLILSKLSFQSVLYSPMNLREGEITQILEKLTNEIGGKFVQAIEPQQLNSAFMQLIPNLYGVNPKP